MSFFRQLPCELACFKSGLVGLVQSRVHIHTTLACPLSSSSSFQIVYDSSYSWYDNIDCDISLEPSTEFNLTCRNGCVPDHPIDMFCSSN